MKAIAYVRKSRKVRAGQAVASAGDQHFDILAHITANDFPPLLNLPGMSSEYPGAFLDNESASKDDTADRPGWRATLNALRVGAADTLIVHAVDRASRMGLRQLLHELPPNARLIALLDGYDSARDDIGQEVMLTVKAREARDYVTKLKARVKGAKDRQRRAGEYSNRPSYGYMRQRDAYGKVFGRLVHHPDRWPIVLRVFESIADGVSLRVTVERLNADGIPASNGGQWHISTVRGMILNDVYAGWMTQRPKGADEAIRILDEHGKPIWCLADGVEPVPAALITRARAKLRGKGGFNKGKVAKGTRLVSQFLTCDGCDGPMSWNGTLYWRCSRHQASPGRCPSPVMVKDEQIAPYLTQRVLNGLSGLDPETPEGAEALARVAHAWFGATQTADADALAEARRAVEEIKARAERLRKAFLDGLYEDDREEYERQNESIKRDREASNAILADLENMASIDVTWMTEPATLREVWDAADLATQRAVFAAALAEVRVYRTYKGEPPVAVEDRTDIRFVWESPVVA
ncbi:recombinase family protein [Actinomadura fulvescens]|uniref:recombinase family protein n=1 Tax=Actinomadura fulvescens TaxID=46160 RepID=UPI0031D378FD